MSPNQPNEVYRNLSSTQHLSHLVHGEATMFSGKLLWLAGSTALVVAGGFISMFAPIGVRSIGEQATVTTELVGTVDEADDKSASAATQVLPIPPVTTLSQSSGSSGGGLGGMGGGPRRQQSDSKGDATEAPVIWQTPEGAAPSWMRDSALAIEQRIDEARSKLFDVVSDVSFIDTPLSQVLELLSEQTGIHMHLNMEELDTEGVDPESPVHLQIPGGSSLREVLRRVLKNLGLTFRVSESSIEITTESAVESDPTLRYYDLSFILASSDQAGQVLRAITNSIHPDSWIENRGTSSIVMVGSMMVVAAPEATHYEIENMLRNLAKISRQNLAPPKKQDSSRDSGAGGMGGMM